jgi:hemoglobin
MNTIHSRVLSPLVCLLASLAVSQPVLSLAADVSPATPAPAAPAAAAAAAAAVPAPSAAEQVAGLQKMCADAAAGIQARQAARSLYERLGGSERITTLATRIVDAHSANPKIAHLWVKVDKPVVSRHVAEFLVTGTGGKGTYTGRDMVSVHAPLKITHEDFLAAGGDVQAVMKGMGYGENEVQEMVCALTSFVPVVVAAK